MRFFFWNISDNDVCFDNSFDNGFNIFMANPVGQSIGHLLSKCFRQLPRQLLWELNLIFFLKIVLGFFSTISMRFFKTSFGNISSSSSDNLFMRLSWITWEVHPEITSKVHVRKVYHSFSGKNFNSFTGSSLGGFFESLFRAKYSWKIFQ